MELKKSGGKVVLITTGQPTGNPRIVKEADALSAAGFDVTLLYCFLIDWAAENDKVILSHAAWKHQMAGGSPIEAKKRYLFTKLRSRAARFLDGIFPGKGLSAERTQARAFDELLSAAKKIKADWYIGHNLGALAIAVQAAEFHNAKAGFDFEDYHRGETTEARDVARVVHLENKYVLRLSYYSTASELITEYIQRDHLHFNGNVITLTNSFPLAQQPIFREKDPADDKVRLFWFSQTIGRNRGLELLIEALQQLNDERFELTLAGRCDEDMRLYLEEANRDGKVSAIFAGIIQPEDLPAFSAKFDAGLALELPTPVNRNICLTNKVFTYLLAGNAIIFSETAMQKKFNEEYQAGMSFAPGNRHQLKACLEFLLNPTAVLIQRMHNYKLAKEKLNWDVEAKKLIALLS